VADAAAAADAVDALPLGAAGFTQQTLEAARDFLLKADPSEWRCRWCNGQLAGDFSMRCKRRKEKQMDHVEPAV